MWLKDKSCETVIKTSWEIPLGFSSVATLSQKTDLCQINLRVWNRNTFGHVRINLEKKLKELDMAEEMGLYSTDPGCIDAILEGITPRVTEEMNLGLTRNFTAEEIHSAMQQMAPLSAPGPDGMPPVFYKSFWHIVGEDVTKASLAILNEGRLITDNVLVAFETLHYLKRKTQGKSCYLALKLDMSKAYDRVEWIFLEKMMLHLGFSDSFVSILMSCIKSVSYAVLFNGEPVGHIKPTRGLRQGDPLSPYMFLLCAIGLQGLLHKA
nr:uncharacterized protein LOC112012991 [Quercus suber]